MIYVGWQAKMVHWMTHMFMYEYRVHHISLGFKTQYCTFINIFKWVWKLALFIVMHYFTELTIKCFCNTFFKHFLIDCNTFPSTATYDDML